MSYLDPRESLAAVLAASLAASVSAQTAPPTPPGGTDNPTQPTVIRDVERSDPFSVLTEDLVASGMTLPEARAAALQQLGQPQGPECLVYELEIIYCDSAGKTHRFRVLIGSNCLDPMWTTPGCIPLTCPPDATPPIPCVLPTCANPDHRPMWDTAINAACFNLPPSIACAWVYPTATLPFWATCTGNIDCSCFPGLVECNGIVVECRNPSKPQQVGDPCPSCS